MFAKLKEELSDKEKRNHYIKYLIVGLITTAISIGGFKLFRMYLPQLNENLANIFSIILDLLIPFTLAILSTMLTTSSFNIKLYKDFDIFTPLFNFIVNYII